MPLITLLAMFNFVKFTACFFFSGIVSSTVTLNQTTGRNDDKVKVPYCSVAYVLTILN